MLNITKLSVDKYSQLNELYHTKGADMASDYFSFAFTAVHKYHETGAIDALNNLLTIAGLLRQKKATLRVIEGCVAHKLQKDGTYGGKVNKKLRDELQLKDAWVSTFMEKVMSEEDAPPTAAPFTVEKFQKAIEAALSKGEKADLDPETMTAILATYVTIEPSVVQKQAA